jgi:hypothetical protein
MKYGAAKQVFSANCNAEILVQLRGSIACLTDELF